jgi:hypothetical protein
VNGHAHSLAEWAAFLSLGVGFWSSCAAVVWLIADADLKDFDPRPAARRIHQGAVYVGRDLAWAVGSARHELDPVVHFVRRTAHLARETARDLAALLILLATRPNGATR